MEYVIKRGEYYLANHPSNHHWVTETKEAKKFETSIIAFSVITQMQDSDCEVASVSKSVEK